MGARWRNWDPQKQWALCDLVYVTFDFLYLVLGIWWAKMLEDVRKTERMMRKFQDLEDTDNADLMIIKALVDGKRVNMVCFLMPKVRILLWCCLLIPKFCIGFMLLIVGTAWLTATDSWAELMLNACGLAFV